MNKKHELHYQKTVLVFPNSPDLVVGTACGGMTYSPLNLKTSSSPPDNADQNTVRVRIGVKNFGSDLSCAYNARSKYLLCTVNPTGTCSDCQHYKRREELKIEGQQHGELLKYLAQLPKGYSEEEILALAAYCAILKAAITNAS
jgi:Family of unknown function (DUF6464)